MNTDQYVPWTLALSVCALAFASVQNSRGQSGPELVFASDRTGRFQLWKVQTDPLGTPVQLTTAGSGSQESRNPSWSQQGKIAYQFGASGARSIHMINPDGSGDVRLTTSGSDEIDPAWSPDGQFIAYAFLTGGNYDIWIHKVGDPNTTADDEDYAFFTSAGQENRPAWSPDGTKIAFASTLNGGGAEIAVSTVVPDSASPGRIKVGSTSFVTGNSSTAFDPTWSPDGQYIAFSSTRSGTRDIYRMSAVGGEADTANFVRLTTSSASDSNPSWSPDGSQIAFVSDRDGNREIYAMSATLGESDASTFKRITNDSGRDDDPTWEQKPPVLLGIDVSASQGVVNWSQVRNNGGKRFAFVKATSGLNGNDGQFLANMQNIHPPDAPDLVVSAYHFAYPNYAPENTGVAEARHFLTVAGGYVTLGYLPPALDIEDGKLDDGTTWVIEDHLTSDALVEWIKDWIGEVQRQKGPTVKPIIYTIGHYALYISQAQLGTDLAAYPLWIVTYPTFSDSDPATRLSTGIAPWPTWTFQQYRSDPATQNTDPNATTEPNTPGTCAGVSSQYVDLDSFKGDLNALLALTVHSVAVRFTGFDGGPIQRPSSGQFQLQISAPGLLQVIVQGSEDLATWTDVATVTITSGTGV